MKIKTALLSFFVLAATNMQAEEKPLRDLSADRPDTTESPDTVDAGHIQLEMSFVEYARALGSKGDSYTATPFNLRLGLTDDTDIGLVFDPYIYEKDSNGQTVEGIGDTSIRWRKNIFGNGEGNSSFSIAPYITLPTSKESKNLGGGVFMPYGYDLSDTKTLGAMLEFNASDNPERTNHDLTMLHTTALWSNLTDKLLYFIEYAGTVEISGDSDSYIGSANGGFQYIVNTNLAFDFAIQRSLFTKDNQVNFILGMVARK